MASRRSRGAGRSPGAPARPGWPPPAGPGWACRRRAGTARPPTCRRPGSRSRRSPRSARGSRAAATTLYLRTATRGPRTTGALAGLLDAGPAGPVVAEYTRDRGGPRELAFRVTARGAREHEVVETVARLDLRVPENRAVAERLLRHRAPWPPAVGPRPAGRDRPGGPRRHGRAQRLRGRGRVAVVRAGGAARRRGRDRGGRLEGRPSARRGERLDRRLGRARAGGLPT